MKLSVIKSVAQRIDAPKTAATSAFTKLRGDTVDVAAVVVGDQIDGNCIWYRTTEGSYYWSGGFAEVNFAFPNLSLGSFSAIDQIKILQQLRQQANIVFKDSVKGYLGCGFGHGDPELQNQLVFLVYVDQKLSLDDPTLDYKVTSTVLFWGFTIQTKVVAISQAIHHAINLDLEKSPPFIGGGIKVTISEKVIEGTRSLGVKRKQARNANVFDHFVLASFHVLFDDLIKNQEKISQGRECIFPINDSIAGKHVASEGCYSPNYDYAAVKLPTDERIINEIDGQPITAFYQIDEFLDLKGKEILSLGFVSGLKRGVIKSVFNNVTLQPHNQEFEDVVFTSKISVAGDSGAPVIEAETKKLIGFVIGGNDNDLSYVLPFYNLNNEKHFEIS